MALEPGHHHRDHPAPAASLQLAMITKYAGGKENRIGRCPPAIARDDTTSTGNQRKPDSRSAWVRRMAYYQKGSGDCVYAWAGKPKKARSLLMRTPR